MKKIVSLILTLLTAFSLCACGMTNDGYVTDNPAATIEPNMTPAPGSGSMIDDNMLTSPSPMPTSSMTSPKPTDSMSSPAPDNAESTASPAETSNPAEKDAK